MKLSTHKKSTLESDFEGALVGPARRIEEINEAARFFAISRRRDNGRRHVVKTSFLVVPPSVENRFRAETAERRDEASCRFLSRIRFAGNPLIAQLPYLMYLRVQEGRTQVFSRMILQLMCLAFPQRADIFFLFLFAFSN